MYSFVKRFMVVLFCFLLILCGNIPKIVLASDNHVLINGIIEWKKIETLDESAGTSSTDWYVIALGDYEPEGTFSDYLKAATKFVNNLGADGFENDRINDLQRMFLAIDASGGDSSGYITQADIFSNDKYAIKDRTINELIFGLILADKTNYVFEGNVKSADFIEAIILLQLADGGFALSGTRSDTDMTAMAVQALSPYVKENLEVSKCVDKAVNTLSLMQKDTGDYSSFGVRNAESTAQVLLALCKMDIDYENDSRFIKQGNTVYDGLLLYKKDDGSFSHILGGNGNDIACAQTLCALVETLNKKVENTPTPEIATNVPTETATTEPVATVSPTETISLPTETVVPNNSAVTTNPEIENKNNISLYIKVGLFGIIAISTFLFLVIRAKKHGIKNKAFIADLALILVITVIVGIAINSLDIKTPQQYYAETNKQVNTKEIGVSISIDCNTIYNNSTNIDTSLKESGLLPENGEILPRTDCSISEGSSVFDILLNMTKESKIQLEYAGGITNSTYIKGINYLYEFSCGSLSGWMYKVNGEFADVSCSDYILKEGDVVEFVYSCDLGRDIGQNWSGEDMAP